MKTTWIFLMIFLSFVGSGHAQSLDEMKKVIQELKKDQNLLKRQVASYQVKIDSISKIVDRMSGWKKGFSGLVGMDFYRSSNWKNNPNPNATSSSLNFLMTAFANRRSTNFFWKNKVILHMGWSDVDLNNPDAQEEDDGLFDNGKVDLLNISSVYGRKLSEELALSSLGELNSSLSNFFDPGTIDLGIGATWSPNDDLTVIVNAINYHLAYSGNEGVKSESFFGAKIRADYSRSFSKLLSFTTVFTSFIPYGQMEAINRKKLFEYTWINTINLNIWRGLGLGTSFGLKKADFESDKLQSYCSFGLSYAISP